MERWQMYRSGKNEKVVIASSNSHLSLYELELAECYLLIGIRYDFRQFQVCTDFSRHRYSQNGQFMSINPCIFRENRPRRSKLLFLSLVP